MIKILSMKKRNWFIRFFSIYNYIVVVKHDNHEHKFNAWCSGEYGIMEDVKRNVIRAHLVPFQPESLVGKIIKEDE